MLWLGRKIPRPWAPMCLLSAVLLEQVPNHLNRCTLMSKFQGNDSGNGAAHSEIPPTYMVCILWKSSIAVINVFSGPTICTDLCSNLCTRHFTYLGPSRAQKGHMGKTVHKGEGQKSGSSFLLHCALLTYTSKPLWITRVRSVALAKHVSLTSLYLATRKNFIVLECLRPSCVYTKFEFLTYYCIFR